MLKRFHLNVKEYPTVSLIFFQSFDIRLVIFNLDNQNTVTKYLCKGGGQKKGFFLGTQFLVVAASRSHYLLKTIPSTGCFK